MGFLGSSYRYSERRLDPRFAQGNKKTVRSGNLLKASGGEQGQGCGPSRAPPSQATPSGAPVRPEGAQSSPVLGATLLHKCNWIHSGKTLVCVFYTTWLPEHGPSGSLVFERRQSDLFQLAKETIGSAGFTEMAQRTQDTPGVLKDDRRDL